MPIVIQELIASDTISQAVDKINFNFDQLILNGGGAVGPRGQIGPIGPIGGRGKRGSKWYEDELSDPGIPPTNLDFIDLAEDDNYLQSNGDVWSWDGDAWNQTGVNLTGPQGDTGVSAGFNYFGGDPPNERLETSIYPAPFTGEGVTIPNEGISTGVFGAAITGDNLPNGSPKLSLLPDELATSINSSVTSLFIHQKRSSAKSIILHGGSAVDDYFEQDKLENLASISIGVDDTLVLNSPKAPKDPNSDLIGFRVLTSTRGQQFRAGKNIEFITGIDPTNYLLDKDDISNFTVNVNGYDKLSSPPKISLNVLYDSDGNDDRASLDIGGLDSVPTATSKGGSIIGEANEIGLVGNLTRINSNRTEITCVLRVGNNHGTPRGDVSTIAGGINSKASGNCSFIGGGKSNVAEGPNSTIGGGESNTAASTYSTVGGGTSNTASSTYSTVGGGGSNTASSTYSTISGGGSNTASCFNSTIGGGVNNTASGCGSVIGGGNNNTASSYGSAISGGSCNSVSGDCAGILGGCSNTVSGLFSVIGGGRENDVQGISVASAVVGGCKNAVFGLFSVIGGGCNNIINGDYSGILGGRNNNTNNHDCSFIIGSNLIATAQCTTFMNNASIEGKVTTDELFTETLEVTDLFVDDRLNVYGTSNFMDDVFMTGNAEIESNLIVDGTIQSYGDASQTDNIQITNSTTGQSSFIWMDSSNKLRIDNATNKSRDIIFNGDGSGRIGIDTTSPIGKLHIKGPQHSSELVDGDGVFTTGCLVIEQEGSFPTKLFIDGNDIDTSPGSSLYLNDYSKENVEIGSDLIVNNNLEVSGNSDIKGNLTVDGDSSLKGNVKVTSVSDGKGDILVRDTDNNVKKIPNAGPIPIGGIIMWSGSTNAEFLAPLGWAICNGQSANGKETPDLQEKFVRGARYYNNGAYSSIGNFGGDETHDHGGNTKFHTLSKYQMPRHDHLPAGEPDTFKYLAGWAFEPGDPILGDYLTTPKAGDINPAGGEMLIDLGGSMTESKLGNDAEIRAEGSGMPHRHEMFADSNLPPYYDLAYIMYVGPYTP